MSIIYTCVIKRLRFLNYLPFHLVPFALPSMGPGNWNSKPKRVYFMQEDPEPLTPQAWHSPDCEEDAAERVGN